MKIISPNELAKTAAQRWRDVYFKRCAWYSLEMKNTYDRLVALGPTPMAADVDSIVGNTSWTSYSCNERGCDRVADVEVGQEADYESLTARLCGQCLQKAVRLLGAYPKA